MSDIYYGKPLKRNGGPYPLKRKDGDAWFYTNRGSISVCIYKPGIGTEIARIPIKTLKRIVKALGRAP